MSVLNIAITKGKSTVEIETDTLPEEVYKEALIQGLKVLLNRGMSKITKETYPDAEQMKVAAMTKAAKNVEAVKEGKIKFSSGTKAKKASGAVMTEARRLARNLIKDEMKRQGIKVSHVEASEITKAANALLDASPDLLAQAEANLKKRETVDVGAKIDLKALVKESPKLVAKAEKAKAEKKSQLSAKQAGMTKKTKPKGEAQASTQH